MKILSSVCILPSTKHILFLFVGIVLVSCSPLIPSAPEDNAVLDGALANLTYQEQRMHLAGDVAFNDEIFTSTTGLGPVFVASSCGSCHAGDGKGHPFTTLTRFGQADTLGNTFLEFGGPQLQNRAIPGFTPETLPAGAPFSKFIAPAVTGLGFLEALSDAQILANADPEDSNGDGISGRPNYISVPPYVTVTAHHQLVNNRLIGRFGKKAAAITLMHQTVNAYSQDMGITSVFAPKDVFSGKEADPEVSNQTIHNVVLYLQTLKAPIQRNTSNPTVQQGKQIFSTIGCASCHIPTFITPSHSIAALSNVTIAPYTDLLLHDMGNELNDGYTEGIALPAEWRTPALWGLGLSPNSQGGRYFLLHDGRAHSLEEAIQYHGGEASASREKFRALPAHDKSALFQFLESL